MISILACEPRELITEDLVPT